jgi:hypothetical protein
MGIFQSQYFESQPLLVLILPAWNCLAFLKIYPSNEQTSLSGPVLHKFSQQGQGIFV